MLKRYKNDWLYAFGIIILVVAIYGTAIYMQKKSLNEEALMYELITLRYAVGIFNVTNQRYPDSMEELIAKSFMGAGEKKKRYIPANLANRKELVDPFGNPYVYDKSSGWVRSSSKDYVNW